MKFQNTQRLFDKSYNYDKKHKINTTNKILPESILKSINNGITIEQIDVLLSKGYNIYKYSTQITIHGKCKELNNDTVGYYKCLTLNKNKSVGVKWIAVDASKKEKICSNLSLFGWNKEHNSQVFYPYKMERFDSKEKAIAKCNEYKNIANRIDNSLFYGSYDIYVGSIWGIYYSVFALYVNGIKEYNVDKLLEQITGHTISFIQNLKSEKEENERIERKKLEREYDENRKKKQIAEKQKYEQIKNKLRNEGYKEVESTSLNIGDKFFDLTIVFGRVEIREYVYGKRTCKPTKMCNMNNNRYCKEPVLVWHK